MKLSERIKSAIRARNNFSLSYDGILTADWGDIVPICCQELVPTDRITAKGQVFMRLAPLASPTFGRIHGFINHFYVPNRILMPEYAFEDSITGGIDGDAPERFPFVTYRVLAEVYQQLLTLWNSRIARQFLKHLTYFGLGWLARDILRGYQPLQQSSFDDEEHSISLLPFLAYARIYSDYYYPYGLEEDDVVRDALTRKYEGLLTSSVVANMDEDGGGLTRLAMLFAYTSSCYTKDYFTTALTRPQRGAASVVPINMPSHDDNPGIPSSSAATGTINIATQNGEVKQIGLGAGVGSGNDIIGRFEAHAMRWAESIQAFLERNNIAGGRYFEQMLARFGVKLRAEELSRSQYLGGSDFWVNVSDVTSTSSSSSGTPSSVQSGLGALAGKGLALGKQNVSFSADEYGFFISLFHFVPETGYVDGLSKMWTRRSKFDYWTPELEDTGLQPIYNKELKGILTGFDYENEVARTGGNGVFGYTPRYSEYKFANPILGGDFYLGSGVFSDALMRSYNLYRRFDDPSADRPVLNADFVRLVPVDLDGVDPEAQNYNRIFQQTDASHDHFFINVQMEIGANRPMLGFAESGMEFANENGSSSVNVPYGGTRL